MYSPSPSIDALVGKSLGEYRVEQLLGQSSVNVLFVARSRNANPVMLTLYTLPGEFSAQARDYFAARFTQEVTALAKLSHPNIFPLYDFGVYQGYPYMVTPLITNGTLLNMLQQQSRLTATKTQEILVQIAAGLDYAHSHGVVHGVLKSANIVFDGNQQVQITGFGLMKILAIQGLGQVESPYAHVLAVGGMFLGAPEYIAPEVVQGLPIDVRSDVYAVGMILFELLSGKLPFTGANPLATALMHAQQEVPSLQSFCPDLPPGIDAVIQRAVARNPAQRYQSVGLLADAFGRGLQGRETAKKFEITAKQSVVAPSEQFWSADLQAKTKITEKGPAISPDMPGIGGIKSVEDNQRDATLLSTAQMAAINSAPSALSPGGLAPVGNLDSPEEMAVDPFVWWSTASLQAENGTMLAPGAPMGAPGNSVTARSSSSKVNKGRRHTVAFLATGGIVALGVLGAGGFGLEHMLQANKKAASTQATQATANKMPGSQPTSPSVPSPTAKATKMATATPKLSPTPKPSPTPAHTGTVIGASSQGAGTSQTFTNPADGAASLLIHLPGGSFVAYEAACPHEGVIVYYNAATNRIVCPRHQALFDPVNNAQVLKGPPPRPLAAVPVRVNGDGTITTG